MVLGMYTIMRKLKGYTHFDFLRDDFMLSQFLLLIDLINEEHEEQKKEEKRLRKSRKR